MRLFVISFSLLLPLFSFSQNLKKPNEKVLYAFSFNSEREVNLLIDTSNKYIVFRMGLPKKIEMEYPANSVGSFDKFSFTYNFKPNGSKNDGFNHNYVSFIHGNKKYVVYEELYAMSSIPDVGIFIIDLNTNISYETKGLPETRYGTLEDLRDDSPIKEEKAVYR